MKPMLAATLENLEDVKLPVIVSPKLDGIRCLIVDGQAVSRALKPIPNKYIQDKLKGLPNGLDGELMLYKGDFNDVQSAVMSEDGEPDFFYMIFDDYNSNELYIDRINNLRDCLIKHKQPIKFIENTLVTEGSLEYVYKLETDYTQMGYEGIMLRSPMSPYKYGRSTLKEGYLLKYKRFLDAEALVIGYTESEHNTNAQTKDALGHSKRSTHKAGLIARNCLGSLIVYDEGLGKEFDIGTGFTQEQREEIWNNQKKYMGATVTYRYQELTYKGVPRFPSFKGFRENGY